MMNYFITRLKSLRNSSTINLLFILNSVLALIVTVTIVLPLLNIVSLT